MHELPITEQIVKTAARFCRENNGRRVHKVNMVIGDYSGYVGEAIQTYFGIIAEGTLCEGASLEFVKVEPKLRCTKCGKLFKKQPFTFECPYCGGQGEKSEVGSEFYIDTIEIE